MENTAEELLYARRDELAKQFGDFARYGVLPPTSPLRRLIDAYITLEQSEGGR